MYRVEFIGDVISAAGYRLSGVTTHIADSKNAATIIDRVCKRASMVMIASSIVRYLTEAERKKLMSSVKPAVLVVPDIKGDHAVPDLSKLIHKQLGMLE